MAETSTQHYGNHAHQPKLSLAAFGSGLAAAVAIGVALVRRPTLETAAALLMALSVLLLVAISRVYIVKLQDRIIRLEMQIRLERLGLADAANRVSMRQLVALRFASDGELPALLARAAGESLTPDQIKRAVTDWQADTART